MFGYSTTPRVMSNPGASTPNAGLVIDKSCASVMSGSQLPRPQFPAPKRQTLSGRRSSSLIHIPTSSRCAHVLPERPALGTSATRRSWGKNSMATSPTFPRPSKDRQHRSLVQESLSLRKPYGSPSISFLGAILTHAAMPASLTPVLVPHGLTPASICRPASASSCLDPRTRTISQDAL